MRHPNIFRKRITHIDGKPQAGDWVGVYANANEENEVPRLFGYGIYNPKSSIAVRLMRWGEELPDEDFWRMKIQQAVSLRRDFLKLPQTTNAYRLIHGEADGFPGIVVDQYGDCLSAEVFSLGMMQRSHALMSVLMELTGAVHHLVRPCPGFGSQEGFHADEYRSDACPDYVTILEGSTKYRVQFGGSHKTGFFCDQRDNRTLLTGWCEGKSVLDICCYTGGFSVRAASEGKASEVIGVDIDEEPLAVAKKNANINHAKVRYCQADAFAFMRDMLSLGRQYDVVILDPPKLIRSRAELEEGTHKHHDLNKLAMQLVKPGGLMLSCTCAGLLTQEAFDMMLHSAARTFIPLAGGQSSAVRSVKIIRKVGAASDHPVGIHCPETEYFKSTWMIID